MQTILEAAEQTLRRDPAATIEQIAEAAGVARTTVHRRFATRDALIGAMTAWAARRFAAAVEDARPGAAPPLIALYQVTANVLRVKIGWEYAMNRPAPADSEVARIHAAVRADCDDLFRRAQQAGILHADADLEWARRVYYALIHEATEDAGDEDTDTLATRVIDTLLLGVGTRPLGGVAPSRESTARRHARPPQ